MGNGGDEPRGMTGVATGPGLVPFYFDPGPVRTVKELADEAEKKIRRDKRLKDALRSQKEKITHVLQGCLDTVNEQLARGETVCTRAHFPLLNPVHFEDLEALAKHDFTIDLHIDEVDAALRSLVGELLQVVFRHVQVENTAKASAQERYTEALMARMATLEHHLSDRAEQLSNCRYKYFHEIMHLRNQLYKSQKEGDDFEAEEVYFFDPCDYLEEELRLLLNDKIKMSVELYVKKNAEQRRRIQDLEDQLADVDKGFDPSAGDTNQVVRWVCGKKGAEPTVAALGEEAYPEMSAWARQWAEREIPPPPVAPKAPSDDSAAKLEEMRAAMARMGEELAEQKRLLAKAAAENSQLQEELEAARAAARRAQEQMDALRAELAKAQQRPRDPETKVVTKVEVREKDNSEELDALKASLAQERERSRAAEDELAKYKSLLEEARKALAAAEAEAARLRDALTAAAAAAAAAAAERKPPPVQAVINRQQTLPQDEPYVCEACPAKDDELERLRRELAELASEAERLRRDMEAAEARIRAAEQELAAAKTAAPTVESLGRKIVEYVAEAEDGIQCQTNITAAGDRAFYKLETEPNDAELAIEQELADLNECARGSWETTLQQIRMAQLPPHGSGPGHCTRGCFLRLFQSARQRIRRHGELIAMSIALKRAELQRVLEGVHLLMESTLPDEDTALREAIFGRGFTQTKLNGSTSFLDFAALEKSWDHGVARIVDRIASMEDDVRVGAHVGRRSFVCAGKDEKSGAGARQRNQDTSPSPAHEAPYAVQEEDEEEREWTTALRAFLRRFNMLPAEPLPLSGDDLALSGKAMLPPGQGKWHPAYDSGSLDALNPHLLAGGRLSILEDFARRPQLQAEVVGEVVGSSFGGGQRQASPSPPPRHAHKFMRSCSPPFRGSLAALLGDLGASQDQRARPRESREPILQVRTLLPAPEPEHRRRGQPDASPAASPGPEDAGRAATAAAPGRPSPSRARPPSPRSEASAEEPAPSEPEEPVPLLYLPFNGAAHRELEARLLARPSTSQGFRDRDASPEGADAGLGVGNGFRAARARGRQAAPTATLPAGWRQRSPAEPAEPITELRGTGALNASPKAEAPPTRAEPSGPDGEAYLLAARQRALGPFCDVEEPQAEPAPARPPSRGLGRRTQSGPVGQGLPRPGQNSDRDIERFRRMMCDDRQARQPMPTAAYEQREEQRKRPIGGRFGGAVVRPGSAAVQPGQAGAGQYLPVTEAGPGGVARPSTAGAMVRGRQRR